MAQTLVAYFSAGGVTRRAAERLAEAAGADLFEIRPAIPYTSADLDWKNPNSRSSVEMRDPSSRPAIAEIPRNMEKYAVVFLGFPIWWYTAPSVIRTFLESCDFSGKTIIPFATSGSSGLGNTVNDLSPLCARTARWLPGKMLNQASDKEIADFATTR